MIMNPDILKIVAQGGAAVALVLVVWLLIRHMNKMMEMFSKIITNHMTHETEATNGVTDALTRLENLLTGWLSSRKD